MSDSSQPDYVTQVFVIGSKGVGKTALIKSLIGEKSYHKPSRPNCPSVHTMRFKDKIVKLEIFDEDITQWDMIDFPDFRRISYALLVFDVTDTKTFDDLKHYQGLIDRYSKDNVSVLVVANKSDLIQERVVDKAVGEEFADCLGHSYIETSAKTGDGVEQAFLHFANQMIERDERKRLAAEAEKKETPPKPENKKFSLFSFFGWK